MKKCNQILFCKDCGIQLSKWAYKKPNLYCRKCVRSHLNYTDEGRLKRKIKALGKNNNFFGRKHNKFSIEKMSIAKTGKHPSNETLVKLSLVRTGKKHSEETKKKMSLSATGRVFTEEHRRNLSNKVITDEQRKNMSIAQRNKNYTPSPETRKKMADSHRAEKCVFWKGGISKHPYPAGWCKFLKEQIRLRDNHICQFCGKNQGNVKPQLHVHHIDYNKDNLNFNNLISLCRSCHAKTNTNREYWVNYFNTLDVIKCVKFGQ